MKLFPLTLCALLFAAAAARAETAPRFEKEIAAFEEADRTNPPPEEAILFIGSSSIRGWRSVADDFPEYRVINRGYGGSVIADSIRFAERIVLPYKPSIVVFYAGENDLSAGLSPEEVAADFKQFAKLVHAQLPNTRIAFISMKPSPSRAHLIESKRIGNQLIQDFVTATPRVDYLDVFNPMLDPAGKPRDDLFIGDKLHMNPYGYTLWKAVVGAYLQGVVK